MNGATYEGAERWPVLVAGAGPAGLVTAITLARLGVRVLVVERRAGLSPFPRATAVSTRTMELIRSWGLESLVRAGEVAAQPHSRLCRNLADPDGTEGSLGFPTAEQARAFSPTGPALVPQDHLEPVLLEHLRGYPAAEVRFASGLAGLAQDADGVTVRLATGGTVRCRYVVGADGAHSTTRDAVGIGMHGPGRLADFLTVLFRAPLLDVVGDRPYGLYMLQRPDRMEVLLPAGDGDRWLYSRQWYPDRERLEDYPSDRLVELVRAGAGVADLPVRILRTGSFAFAAQVADRFRAGRVFLVGDAAHRMTPRGGTGMNTAIHDGYDVGWKLGWAVRGWAGPELLDSYEEERRPVGERNTLRSAQPGEPSSGDPFAEDLGGRLAHLWQERDGRRYSTLDLLGGGLTLLTAPAAPDWRAAAAQLTAPVPLDVHGVDRVAAAALGLEPGGALLARPDGQPVTVWAATPADPAGDLRAAVAAVTARHPAGHPAEMAAA